MSEVDLIDDDFGAPKKKRGLPKWLLGCGCGCTILIILASVVLVLAGMEMTDSEKQWSNLREELYFEERPTDLEMQAGIGIPFAKPNQYTLLYKGGEYTMTLSVYDIPEQTEMLFKTEGSGIESVGIPKNAKLGETLVQGRLVRSMTDTGMAILVDIAGPGIRIDISTADNSRVVELRAREDGEALNEDEVKEFFSMFDVWHQ